VDKVLTLDLLINKESEKVKKLDPLNKNQHSCTQDVMLRGAYSRFCMITLSRSRAKVDWGASGTPSRACNLDRLTPFF